ncbi:hypothetical protein A2U01_0034695, partial [Trifolium medium]|nr:hypothetical protein [Trifolium medium]
HQNQSLSVIAPSFSNASADEFLSIVNTCSKTGNNKNAVVMTVTTAVADYLGIPRFVNGGPRTTTIMGTAAVWLGRAWVKT